MLLWASVVNWLLLFVKMLCEETAAGTWLNMEHVKVRVQHCTKQGDLQNSLTFIEYIQEDPLQSAHMKQFKIISGGKFYDQYGGTEIVQLLYCGNSLQSAFNTDACSQSLPT